MPNRLSSGTHTLAHSSLRGELAGHFKPLSPPIKLDLYQEFPPLEKYSRLVRIAAQQAPLLIRPMERIAGSATILEGANHKLFDLETISHTTLDFKLVLKTGICGLVEKIKERMETADAQAARFLKSALSCIDSLRIWNGRYVKELEKRILFTDEKTKEIYSVVYSNMCKVPEQPPTTFHEALQAFWTLYSFLRLLGNWSGLGRIDQLLGPYLKNDLATGRITLNEARELLAHFFIRGTEWTGVGFGMGGSGDKQFYQNILIGGIDAHGNEVTNEVSYLVLDIIEELGISDFPLSVRLNRSSPELLIRRTAEVIRKGGGIVAWYDEERVIEALVKFGFHLCDAREFTNDGCWEAIIGGKSAFGYAPFDMLLNFQTALQEGADTNEDFESLYDRFQILIKKQIYDIIQEKGPGFMMSGVPTPFLSLFVEGCIECGRQYTEQGAKYNILAVHAGGMPDTANAFTAVRKFVFEDKRMTLREMASAVKNDWVDIESLRLEIKKNVPRYGNDLDEPDLMMMRLFNDFTDAVAECQTGCKVMFPAGLSTFGRQLTWREHRTATPDGFKKGAILSGNASPVPGTTHNGPTAVLLSAGKLDYTKLPNGCALDLNLEPGLVSGDEGLEALCAIIKGSLVSGVFLVQVNVMDVKILRQAQKNPEQFPELTVRISGWSARFVSLSREWQEMVIGRLAENGLIAHPPKRYFIAESK